jgi:CRISPR system Cascade subunit CasD
MQSWGTQSRFSTRDTGLEPSRSGVIGLLCAALGRPREEPLNDFSALRMGVRVDREGVLQSDYHTAGGWHRRADTGYGVPTPSGGGHRTVTSTRYFLADAEFLVGLEGDRQFLDALNTALVAPCWQICLGRKAFLPSAPVHLPATPPAGPGVREGTLEQVLGVDSGNGCPWLGFLWPRTRRGDDEPPRSLRVVLEPRAGEPAWEVRQDVPFSFATRSFGSRQIVTRQIDPPRMQQESA